jgi:prepilin-type processing-associated H-X9-DG protein
MKCAANLHVLGQGLTMYSSENGDVFLPSRMPKVDDCHWQTPIEGGLKYRPTFLAMMGSTVGVAPFEDPRSCKTEIDAFGEPGDQQDFSSPVYVCPSAAEWTDERNGSYGYNYQFLGNSRLSDSDNIYSFKNWPVVTTRIRVPAATVAVADCMGTAASYPKRERGEYVNNSRDAFRYGNEGFNLDPPRVDPVDGEMAGFDEGHRTAAHTRHNTRANVLWVDGHADPQTLGQLGYVPNPDGSIGFEGNNALWSGNRRDVAWTRSVPR